MSERKISYETSGEMAITVNFLRSLVEGLEKKRVVLSSAKEEVVLYPGDLVDFKVKARVKKNEGKIELKLAWKQEPPGPEILIGN